MAVNRISPDAKARMRQAERAYIRYCRLQDRKDKATIKRIRTLFDPASNELLFQPYVFSYLKFLTQIENSARSHSSSLGSEAHIFDSLAGDERSFTGWLNNHHWWVGDLQYRNARGKKVNLNRNRPLSFPKYPNVGWDKTKEILEKAGLGIPDWVESDTIDFQRCGAKAILLVEKYALAIRLLEQNFWQRENLLMISSGGLPSFLIRRLIHRLEQTYRLPTYVLADNDTWGYFMVSALRRGMTAPNLTQPPFAVKDVRFLGLRAFDFKQFGVPQKDVQRPWKPQWDLRLAAMAKTEVYASATWRREFRRFKKQHGAVELEALAGQKTPQFIDFLSDKLRTKNWIK